MSGHSWKEYASICESASDIPLIIGMYLRPLSSKIARARGKFSPYELVTMGRSITIDRSVHRNGSVPMHDGTYVPSDCYIYGYNADGSIYPIRYTVWTRV